MFKKLFIRLRLKLKEYDWFVSLYEVYLQPFDFSRKIRLMHDYRNVVERNSKLLTELPRASSNVKMSIVTPVYKPNLKHFKLMVDSVINQTYSNWELILVDDYSLDNQLDVELRKLEKHPQILVHQRASNGHISRASNDAIDLATGDYIVLLDHDDLLHKEALNTVALFIQNSPNANVLYSDEDKVNESGGYEQAHHKPKWNPDLLYSHNYICHLAVYKKSLIEKIGGFREGLEGSQDYDLVLRAIESCNAQGVIHVPYVLYHWRIAEGSTAFLDSEKNYTHQAGLKAIQNHVVAHKGATVESGVLSNTYKVNWAIPDKPPLVSIIIPTRNSRDLVKQCIDSLYSQTDYCNFEVLLVDNQSNEPESLSYFKCLAEAGKVHLIAYNKPFNYSAINNFAVERASGEIIVLMNNDVELTSAGWLTEMVRHCLRDAIGCVGAKLYYPNNTVQHAGVVTGIGGVAGHPHKHYSRDHPGYFKRLMVTQNYTAVTGACLAVRKSIFEEVGGLNEADLVIAFNDVDFCLKVQKAGYRNLWTPYAEMVHHESLSRGAEDTPEKVKRFNKEVEYMINTWGESLEKDPCYSPWLSLKKEDFSLRK